MTDRELLEAAAKAADMDIAFDRPRATGKEPMDWDTGEPWNPLTDDGDALRLAVKLGIGISKPDRKFRNVRRAFLSDLEVFSVMHDDPLAATRRAIVRAAAEIGRSMK